MNNDKAIRDKVQRLMQEGIYHQIELFALLYPHFDGHYSKLRQLIAEEKNNAK